MAESHEGFDAIASPAVESIRENLRRTMVLGLPVEDDQKPTFYFDRVVSWQDADAEGNPWDWTATPATESNPSSVQPVCAFEFFSPLGRQGAYQTEVGEFNPTTVVFTMFEDEWEQVQGFSYVTIGPSTQKWYFRYWRPAYGLGDMTVYQVHCVAEGTP